jgi:hypothetical protein
MLEISTERKAFSSRLQQCLRDAHHSPDSGTRLVREFNSRFLGEPVTVHAVRKWLVGEAIPTQDKMQTLAAWLQVSADWLRYGGGEQEVGGGVRPDAMDAADLKMLADIQRLDEHDRDLVRKFVSSLVHSHRQ